MEMNACASEEAARADAELNEVYHKLLSKAASQQEAVAKIQSCRKSLDRLPGRVHGRDVPGKGQTGRVRFHLSNGG